MSKTGKFFRGLYLALILLFLYLPPAALMLPVPLFRYPFLPALLLPVQLLRYLLPAALMLPVPLFVLRLPYLYSPCLALASRTSVGVFSAAFRSSSVRGSAGSFPLSMSILALIQLFR